MGGPERACPEAGIGVGDPPRGPGKRLPLTLSPIYTQGIFPEGILPCEDSIVSFGTWKTGAFSQLNNIH